MKQSDEYYFSTKTKIIKVYNKNKSEVERANKEIKDLKSKNWLVSSKVDGNYTIHMCYEILDLEEEFKKRPNISRLKYLDEFTMGIYNLCKDNPDTEIDDKLSKEIMGNFSIIGKSKSKNKEILYKKRMFTYNEYVKCLDPDGLIQTMMGMWKRGRLKTLYHQFDRTSFLSYELNSLFDAQSLGDEKSIEGALDIVVKAYRANNYSRYRKLAESIADLIPKVRINTPKPIKSFKNQDFAQISMEDMFKEQKNKIER